MKLVIKKDQEKKGLLGKVKFKFTARVELTSEESKLVERYKMGSTELHSKDAFQDKIAPRSIAGAITDIAIKKIFLNITISNLVDGVIFECKTIDEILQHETAIKEACEKLVIYLDTMKHFGGEEVINYNEEYFKNKEL
jgi:hypothetical protein